MYQWKEIKFPSDENNWEKSEQVNKNIALNILVTDKGEKISNSDNTSNKTTIFLKT